jgi:NAD-dependent dihydropyrimidine dehydrogenase PreA subunit
VEKEKKEEEVVVVEEEDCIDLGGSSAVNNKIIVLKKLISLFCKQRSVGQRCSSQLGERECENMPPREGCHITQGWR